jgi:TolA-binding protein
MSSQAGEDGDGVMTPLDGPPGSDDEYDSRDEEPQSAVSPFDRRDSMGAPLGPPSFTHHTRSSQSLPLPSIHNPDLEITQATIERLREEVGTLRRQSAEAVSVSLRLSEQLAQAQREVERARNEIRDLEDALEDEQQRRADAENLVNLERARNRPIPLHPDEMQQMVQDVPPPQPPRSPQQARGPM